MDSLLIAARIVQFAAAISLCGLFAFACLIAGPALREAAVAPAALPRLRRNLARLGWASLWAALASGAAWLAATAVGMSGRPLEGVLTHGTLVLVLAHTRFGQVWLLRLVLAAMLGCCVAVQSRQRDWASGAAAWIGLGGAALLLASLAWAGHGAATPGTPGDLHLAADILHLVAAGLWLGTLLPLALLLAEIPRLASAALARAAIRRFSTIAMASVAVLFAAGLVNTWFLAGTVPALIGTAYGRLLLTKVAIFAATLLIAAVNLFRLSPRLAMAKEAVIGVTLGKLRHNAVVEAGCGLAVLAIVGVLGVLPPGLHSEPGWPLPFRIDPALLGRPAAVILAMLALLAGACAVAGVVFAAAADYRRAGLTAAGFIACLAAAWLLLRPAMLPAYPTTYETSPERYAAPSVARGLRLYAENCALCHGAGGNGDGPAAAGLPIRPPDLTSRHLLAHQPGDLFWWIGHGLGNGAMPGFAAILQPARRWDLVNFIRARAAGIAVRRLGPEVAADAAFPMPDFAFEQGGRQRILRALLARGPVLLILYLPPPPAAELARLAAAGRQLADAGLSVLAADLGPAGAPAADETASVPLVEVAGDVAASLRLFISAAGQQACALLLDRAGNVRARWRLGGAGGRVDPDAFAAAAGRLAGLPSAASDHAGHRH